MEMLQKNRRSFWFGIIAVSFLLALVTLLSPTERTLGESARLVYFHGAWVWAGKIAFGIAGLSGLLALLLRKEGWLKASLALGRTGLFFWLTYLPMSLLVQQMNWGGIFWDEPRWRVPLTFGIVGLLLQLGLWVLDNLKLTAVANLIFGALLWWFLGNIQNVLHPDSPIFQSNAVNIQISFVLLLALSVAFGALFTLLLLPTSDKR